MDRDQLRGHLISGEKEEEKEKQNKSINTSISKFRKWSKLLLHDLILGGNQLSQIIGQEVGKLGKIVSIIYKINKLPTLTNATSLIL